MQSITVQLENCYGIKALSHKFDFSNNNCPVVIYAPNGVMKTSFARSMNDYAKGRVPKDLIFDDRPSKCDVTEDTGSKLTPEAIFVIESLNERYQSDRISTLLASAELKKEYDSIFGKIADKKNNLFSKLKKTSGLPKDIEEQFCQAFGIKFDGLMTALGRLEREVKRDSHVEFGTLKYKDLFGAKVVEFLNDSDIKRLIIDYTNTYDQILSRSRYFKKGVFNHSNAETIAKNLKANGWFEGGHSVTLNHGSDKSEILSDEALISAIDQEKKKILTDPKLAEMFNKVDKALSNVELRAFREYLIEHPFVLPELSDVGAFKQKVWISYLVAEKSDYLDLMDDYDKSSELVKAIISKAEAEQTSWESVINIFNDRFSVPFEVKVENKGDAVLNLAAPQIVFDFHDDENKESKRADRSLLDNVLSNGERRALYILNILFEIEARKKAGVETLLVIDDIADSFDYKNKYAIVEYLKDMREDANFHLIILTHNFDFYRTIKSRIGVYGDNKLLSNRQDGAVTLVKDTFGENPFIGWKDKMGDVSYLIASIPFVRNLAEYTGNTNAFDKLTSLLHIKKGSREITFSELFSTYKNVLMENTFADFSSMQGCVLDEVFSLCEEICGAGGNLSLEQKIVLALGIRLKAEILLIDKINDDSFVSGLRSNQTGRLVERYKKSTNSDHDILGVMRKVMLMTPEQIHLNSFMFEPILDMSGHHLCDLYNQVVAFPIENTPSLMGGYPKFCVSGGNYC